MTKEKFMKCITLLFIRPLAFIQQKIFFWPPGIKTQPETYFRVFSDPKQVFWGAPILSTERS